MWQSVETLNVFSTLILKQIFWKTKTFFEILEYCFLVESSKTENASMSEANAETNKMKSRNGSITKKGI